MVCFLFYSELLSIISIFIFIIKLIISVILSSVCVLFLFTFLLFSSLFYYFIFLQCRHSKVYLFFVGWVSVNRKRNRMTFDLMSSCIYISLLMKFNEMDVDWKRIASNTWFKYIFFSFMNVLYVWVCISFLQTISGSLMRLNDTNHSKNLKEKNLKALKLCLRKAIEWNIHQICPGVGGSAKPIRYLEFRGSIVHIWSRKWT